jgi:uncharacterized iron-regulated membrane protein
MKYPPLVSIFGRRRLRERRTHRLLELLAALWLTGLVACGEARSGSNGSGGADAGPDLAPDGQVELDLPETPDLSPDLSPDADEDAPDAAPDADEDALTGGDTSPDTEAAPEPNQLTTIIAGGQARSANYSARVRLLPPLTGTTVETGGDDE